MARLAGEEARVGLAVSGGADSLALLLLAAAALPGRVEAATIDHGFHSEGTEWGGRVATVCAELGVPHVILTVDWGGPPPAANRQARAREARDHLLCSWALDREISAIATAHHLDDQAETLLMRLSRGAGVGGLAGVREVRLLGFRGQRPAAYVRPLLRWRRSELARIVAAAEIDPVLDPANDDLAHDRTRVRRFLDGTPDWPDRERMAVSAARLADADEALDWMVRRYAVEHEQRTDDGIDLPLSDLPAELQFRLVARAVGSMASCDDAPRGDVVARALERLNRGEVASLSGVVIRPLGDCWRFEWAPPRRN